MKQKSNENKKRQINFVDQNDIPAEFFMSRRFCRNGGYF